MNRVVGSIWKYWVKPLILYGILWAGFHYWLDFSNKQSVVFAFLFGSCYYGFKELYKKTDKAEDFTPYRVSVSIHNPRDLLFRYNFLKTDEDWKQMCEKLKDTSILRRGLNFTVLSLSKEGLPHLIWWDDHKIFLAGIPSFEEELQGLEFPNESSIRISREWSPRLYFGYRHGTGHGYTLALSVTEKWWGENKTPETRSTEVEKDHFTGSVYLVLGTLPYGEIGLDYEARRQDRKIELEKLGWAIKDFHEPELRSMDTIEVQNSYFSVSQRFLETD